HKRNITHMKKYKKHNENREELDDSNTDILGKIRLKTCLLDLQRLKLLLFTISEEQSSYLAPTLLKTTEDELERYLKKQIIHKYQNSLVW
ncbi:6394_t:CDS:2, partial [Scutellospora calospora]